MDYTNIAHTISAIGTLLLVGGATGLTQTDINGFTNVIIAIVTLVSVVIAHFSHKAAVAQAS